MIAQTPCLLLRLAVLGWREVGRCCVPRERFYRRGDWLIILPLNCRRPAVLHRTHLHGVPISEF